MDLDKRRILVTGASSGIGRYVARLLAENGARVVASARRWRALESLAGENDRITPLVIDVTDPQSISRGVAEAAELLGGLDGLFNNAGVAWGGKALDMGDDDWDRVIEVNLNGAFRVARESARIMAADKGGAILNTASILSFGTGEGIAAYGASKAAIEHLTRSLALEWARHGIRVNAIAPGYFPTEMTEGFLESERGQQILKAVPMHRFGRLEDLAGPVLLLLSDAGAYITGATLPVDGGHLVRPL